jgi:hypothetical protein
VGHVVERLLQDTAVAMRALIEYTVRQRIRDVSSLSVTVEATSLQGHVRNLYVNEKNLAQLQKIEVIEEMLFFTWTSLIAKKIICNLTL